MDRYLPVPVKVFPSHWRAVGAAFQYYVLIDSAENSRKRLLCDILVFPIKKTELDAMEYAIAESCRA